MDLNRIKVVELSTVYPGILEQTKLSQLIGQEPSGGRVQV